jgi:hypothetical protein
VNSSVFFKELKQYNTTNYRALLKADLSIEDASTIKAFSSAITRFFIFIEKHPEVTETDRRVLYYKLKLDMVAQFFAEFPESNLDLLKGFQFELQSFDKKDDEVA